MGSLTNDFGPQPLVAGGTTKNLNGTGDSGQTIKLDQLAGTTVTLPPGVQGLLGVKYRFLQTVVPTSNSHVIKVANALDFFIGALSILSDDAAGGPVKAFFAANSGTVATNSDTITLNRTTQGGTVVGEWIEVELVSLNTWLVRSMLQATGTEASPFTAGV